MAKNLKVFLSYSRDDQELCTELKSELKKESIGVYLDVDETLPGEIWWGRLQELIRSSDAIIFIITNNSLSSRVCQDEIEYAEKLHKRIFSIVSSGVDFDMLPPNLAKLQAIPYKSGFSKSDILNLSEMLTVNIDWIRTHTKVIEQSTAWIDSNKDLSHLTRGKALSTLEEWLKSKPPHITISDLQIEYIRKSISAENLEKEKMDDLHGRLNSSRIEILENNLVDYITNQKRKLLDVQYTITENSNNKDHIYASNNSELDYLLADAILTLHGAPALENCILKKLKISSRGDVIATLTNDNVLRVWDSNRYSMVFEIRNDTFRDFEFSVDNKYIIATPNLNEISEKKAPIKLINASNGNVYSEISAPYNLSSVSLSRNNKYLMGLGKLSEWVYGGWGTISVWNLENSALITKFGSKFVRAEFSHDSSTIRTWDENNYINEWDVLTGAMVDRELPEDIIAIDGDIIVRHKRGSYVIVENKNTREVINDSQMHTIVGADVSVAAKKVYLYYDNEITILDIRTGSPICSIEQKYKFPSLLNETTDEKTKSIRTALVNNRTCPHDMYVKQIYSSGKQVIRCHYCDLRETNEPPIEMPNFEKYNEYVEIGLIEPFPFVLGESHEFAKKLLSL